MFQSWDMHYVITYRFCFSQSEDGGLEKLYADKPSCLTSVPVHPLSQDMDMWENPHQENQAGTMRDHNGWRKTFIPQFFTGNFVVESWKVQMTQKLWIPTIHLFSRLSKSLQGHSGAGADHRLSISDRRSAPCIGHYSITGLWIHFPFSLPS